MKNQLPNGCSHSQLSIYPKNWKTKAARITIDWFISYRFYDPNHSKPKQIMIKGMNAFKTLPERQQKTQELFEQELKTLQGGHNPFVRVNELIQSATSEMGLMDALRYALASVSVSEVTRHDLKYAVTLFERASKALGIENLLIVNLSRKHYKVLLESASNSNDRFNKNRSYLMILLSLLCELEIIESNPVRDIKKKKTVKAIRQTLSPEERIKVNSYLKENYPSFHRFLHIFYHSGARISEMVKVKAKDVQLSNQRFKVTIKKGQTYVEVWKVIKDVAMPYWQEVMNAARDSNHFVFSEALEPGISEIKPYQIGKRWYRLVKQKLGIEADFYSLKHLHTTEVVDLLDDKTAAQHNSHTSTTMVNKVYDVNNKNRRLTSIKTLKNEFAII
jgi:integrase